MDSKEAGSSAALPAVAAFVLWGGWAFYANLEPSNSFPLLPALVQGSASSSITLLMALAVQQLHILFAASPRLAAWLPPFVIVAITSTLLVVFHSLAGTPNLAATVIPPSAVAFAFCLYLSLRLAHRSQAHAKELLP